MQRACRILLASCTVLAMMIRAGYCLPLMLMLLFCSAAWPALQAPDVKQVPLWDGETSSTPDGALVNRYGGPVVHQGTTKTTVSRVANVFHSGRGAYRVAIAGPVSDYAFFQLALGGFGPSTKYVMSRDFRRFDSLSFCLRNDTGVRFTLKLEIKDYRDGPPWTGRLDREISRWPTPAERDVRPY